MKPKNDEDKLLRSVALQNARSIRIAREHANEARGLLAAIVESSDDAIISKDLNGIITSWNRGAERIFGYSVAEAIGQSITILIPTDRLDEETRIRERLRHGELIQHYETIRRRKDGSFVDISLSVSPIINTDGQIVGAAKIARDISGRKRSEEALARLAAIVESSDDAIISKDLDGIITSWNQAAARLFGYGVEEVLGKSVTILIPPERRDEEPTILAKIRRGERIDHYETRRQRKDGSLIEISLTVSPIMDTGGVVIGASKIARDITPRKQGEKRLLRLSETLLSVMEAIPDVVFVMRTPDCVEFQNRAASQLSTALGLRDRLPLPIEAELIRVMQTGENHVATQFQAAHRFLVAGEERYFLSRIVGITAANNLTFGAVVMLQDVTNFRLLDEVKTNLIATVTHELKTPLTSLSMALVLLKEQSIGSLNPKQLEMATVAGDETERLLRTLNALLDLTRFEQDVLGLRMEKVVPEELIQSALEETQRVAANAGVSVKREIQEGLPALNVDRERILHVLTNFLSNAIKYSAPGSEITLCARKQITEIYFSVIDRGPGIAPEFQTRIFERFYRVPSTPKTGAGLGLSIARDFVRAHRGQIGVRSAPGRGSEFYFVLPIG